MFQTLRVKNYRKKAVIAAVSGASLAAVIAGPSLVAATSSSFADSGSSSSAVSIEAEGSNSYFRYSDGPKRPVGDDLLQCDACSGSYGVQMLDYASNPQYLVIPIQSQTSRRANVAIKYVNPSSSTLTVMLSIISPRGTSQISVDLPPTGSSLGSVSIPIDLLPGTTGIGFIPTEELHAAPGVNPRVVVIDRLEVGDVALPPLGTPFFGPSARVADGKVFRIDGGCSSNTGNLTTDGYDRTYLSEQWRFVRNSDGTFTVLNECMVPVDAMGGKALKAVDDSNVVMDTPTDDNRFKWRINYNDNGYQLVNVATGKALDFGDSAGTRVTTSDPSNSTNQRFKGYKVDGLENTNSLQ